MVNLAARRGLARILTVCALTGGAIIGGWLHQHPSQPAPNVVRQQLEAQLQAAPPTAQQAHAAGLAALQRGEYSVAERSFTAALSGDPTLALDWFQLGVTYSNTKRPLPALKSFQQAVALESHFADAWYNIGLLQTDRSDFQAAQDALQRAVTLDPDFELARLALSRVDLKIGAAVAAEQLAREAVRRAPQSANAWLGLGDVLAERPDASNEALQCFERAEVIQPDSYGAFRLGQMAMRLNRPQQALPALQRATQLDPINPTPWYLLARAQMALGRPEASATLQRAQQVRQWAHNDKILNVAIDQRPTDATLYFRLGAVQAQQGLRAAAIKSYLHGLRLAPTDSAGRRALQALMSEAPSTRKDLGSSAP